MCQPVVADATPDAESKDAMGDWRIDRLLEDLTSERIILASVWAGLAALTVILLVMMRTQWGQSQPLRKCIFLSLLAHLLLGMYAFTVRIATSARGTGDESVMTVQAVEMFEDGEATDDPALDELSEPPDEEPDGDRKPEPWEALTTSDASVPEEAQAAESVERPAPEARPVERPVAEDAPEIPADAPLPASRQAALESAPVPERVVADAPRAGREAPQDAAPIEAPAAARQEAPSAAPLIASMAAPAAEPTDVEQPAPSPNAPAPLLPTLPIVPAAAGAGDATRPSGAVASQMAPLAPVPTPTMTAIQPSPAVGAGIGASGSAGPPAPAAPNELYQNRTAPDRAARAQRFGATAQTEGAVQAALRWLAANQSSDGRWDASRFGAGIERRTDGHDRQGAGADADTGITGLALLAFLGAGHTHETGEYATTVARGINFLIAQQARDGSLGGEAQNYAFMYCHGIASLALTETYGMTHDSKLLEPVRRAVHYTLTAQNPSSGGWRYRPWRERPGDRGDMSQFGWQLMVLRSAELSGLPVPEGNKRALLQFLQLVSSGPHGGLASYRPGERASLTMTAEALVCRQFLGLRREEALSNEAGEFLMQTLPSDGGRNFYYWYYGTLAMFQLQGTYWERWNASMQRALVNTQVTGGTLAGSWEPDPQWGGYGGRVYSTALGALCLEVYFRYLPLYAETTAKKEPATSEDKPVTR